MTTRVLEPPSDAQTLVQRAAFQLLLRDARPVSIQGLSRHSGVRVESVSRLVEMLDAAGRIRRNGAGQVVGSGGLSVVLDRHEIELEGRRFWTWCAYDILGIFGALGASGRAVSPRPAGDRTIRLDFVDGRPYNNDAVLFRPDEELMNSRENVYEQWCPNSNLFANRDEATEWADAHRMAGRVLELDEASDLATKAWADII